MSQGIICFWAYSEARIPPGWHICDGEEGTPDLRDTFLVGAGNTYAVGARGGQGVHDHNFTADGHWHPPIILVDFFVNDIKQGITTDPIIGITDHNAPFGPPWYGLIPIQKL